MDEASNARYWCHACSRTVIPVMAVEIECPRCHTGFVEQMGGAAAAAADDDDLVSDRALSLLAPILLGMLADRNPRTESQDDDPNAADDDGAGESRRPQRRIPAIVRLLRRSDPENPSRGGDRIILIGPFRQAILLDDPGAGIAVGDYFVGGEGLDQLLQQLGEGDPSKYGAPPARKEAVEAMPTVRVEEAAATCAVCLEDLAVGEEAREMPCAHLFHGACIVPWLGLHGSCPVCRYQMPVEEEEEEEAKEPSNGDGGGEGVNGGGGEGSVRRLWVPLPWPLSMLFSSPETAGAETQSHGSSGSSGSDT